jgi:hypothetical protein
MEKLIKTFKGEDISELPREVRIFITEKLRRGWVKKAVQEEIEDLFGLHIPETFIFCCM